MSEIETIAYQGWNGGLTLEEWKNGFDILKQSGTYELTLGDLVPPGIAHCTKKNLLIFNTSPQAHCPVYLISAATFGGSANSDIPVCLAYDQAHYESLVPCSDSDIEKAVILSKQVQSGEYDLKMEDIPIFGCTQSKSANYDFDFPPLASKGLTARKTRTQPKVNENSEECMLTLEELRKIPGKKRKPEESKRYKQLMYQRKKMKKAEEQSVHLAKTNKRRSSDYLETKEAEAEEYLSTEKREKICTEKREKNREAVRRFRAKKNTKRKRNRKSEKERQES